MSLRSILVLVVIFRVGAGGRSHRFAEVVFHLPQSETL